MGQRKGTEFRSPLLPVPVSTVNSVLLHLQDDGREPGLPHFPLLPNSLPQDPISALLQLQSFCKTN